jgi:hypothetical protein
MNASPSWWRRNRWGLVALLPALAAAIGPGVREGYRHHRDAQPSAPIGAGADGWVVFAGAHMRLAEITPATELRDYRGRRYTPPSSLRVWRAEIVFDGTAREALAICRLLLEDAAGRTFDAGPAELRGLRIPLPGCTPQPAGPDAPSRSNRADYATMAYFVTPASARPVAVRVMLTSLWPSYARLTGG